MTKTIEVETGAARLAAAKAVAQDLLTKGGPKVQAIAARIAVTTVGEYSNVIKALHKAGATGEQILSGYVAARLADFVQRPKYAMLPVSMVRAKCDKHGRTHCRIAQVPVGRGAITSADPTLVAQADAAIAKAFGKA